ncbi:MAG: inverse autotransporter beta domain-containing protein [bacterium]
MVKKYDWRGLFAVLLAMVLFFASAGTGLAVEAPSAPDGQLTIMGRGGDSTAEGTLDLLAPLYQSSSGLWFVNPRFTYNDDSESEVNLGVGYRRLLRSRDVIVGGNLYYDSRWPGDGVQFNQFGAGLEVLSKWIDARANYYLPENDKEVVDVQERTSLVGVTTTKSYDQRASGNTLYETSHTTTTETSLREVFTTMVGTMDGFDAEVGFKLPLLAAKFETRLFGGYYRFSPNLNLEDVEGFKARIEIRALPALVLDAAYYDDDKLFGSSYMVGGRVQLPFDVANLVHGRNPFEGTRAVFKPGVRAFASRLTENVVRDPHIQICKLTETAAETILASTASDATYAYLSKMIFVDGDNNSGVEDGSFQHPFNTVQEGVDAAKARGFGRVYVFAASSSYGENVAIGNDLDLIGEGKHLGTDGGFGGRFPVIDGSAGASAALNVEGAGNVKIRGFDLMNTGAGFPLADINPAMSIPAGVLVHNTTSVLFSNNRVHDAPAGFMAIYDAADGFSLDLHHNSFRNTGLAIGVMAAGSSGNVSIQHNTIDNSLAGVGVLGIGNTSIVPVPDSVVNVAIHGNSINGGSVRLDQMVTGNLLNRALDLFGFSVPADHPAMILPSVAGVIAVAAPGVEMNLAITDNTVLDNMIGIGVGAMSSKMTADISGNTIRGGGVAGVMDVINAHDLLDSLLPSGMLPESLSFDDGLLGVGAVAYGDGALITANIRNNTIERNAIGVGALELSGASLTCVVDGNEIADNLVGVVAAGIDGSALNLTVTGNAISGGGGEDIVALVDGNRAPVGQYGAIGVGVLAMGADTKVNAVIEGNTVDNNLLGVGAASLNGGEISSLTIAGNTINGAGMSDINDLLSDTPVVGADFGVIGIGLANSDGDILNARITGNTVNGNVIGIGAIQSGTSGTILDAEIDNNVLNHNACGIAAEGSGLGSVMNLDIHGNTLNGGYDFASDAGDVLSIGFNGNAGIVCSSTAGADMTLNINNNTIRDSSGFGVNVTSGEDSSIVDLTLSNNSIKENGLLGVLLETDMDGTMTADIKSNTIIDNNQSGLVPGSVPSAFVGLVYDTSVMTISPLQNNVSDGNYYIGYDPAPATFIGVPSGNTLEDLVTPANIILVPMASVPSLPW